VAKPRPAGSYLSALAGKRIEQSDSEGMDGAAACLGGAEQISLGLTDTGTLGTAERVLA